MSLGAGQGKRSACTAERFTGCGGNNQQTYPQSSIAMSYVRVAVDVPLATLFDYRLDGADRGVIGALALVPFGRSQALGVIVEVGQQPSVDTARIRPLTRVLSETPPLPGDILELLQFCSEYYHHPIGEVVHAALPPSLRTAPRARTRS